MKVFLTLLILLVTSPDAEAQHWTRTAGPVEDDVFDICIDSNGWLFAMTALGLNRSTDGGHHWTRPYQFGGAAGSPLVIVAPNGNIVFSGDSGIYVSTDKGETVLHTYVPSMIVADVFQFAISGSGRIFAGGMFGTICSDDNGLTWKQIKTGVSTSQHYTFAVAASQDTVIIMKEEMHMNLSFNDGDNWDATWSLGLYATQLHILRDGSRVAITTTDILGNSGDIMLNPLYWESLINHRFGATRFYSLDEMPDGTIFVSTFKHLYATRDFIDWDTVDSGLQLDSTGKSALVLRVAYNKQNNAYYAATHGLGVCKSGVSLSASGAVRNAMNLQIAPNPLTSSATIRFVLDRPSEVTIGITDILGRSRLHTSEFLGEGIHERALDVAGLAAGAYLITLHANGTVRTQWVSIVK